MCLPLTQFEKLPANLESYVERLNKLPYPEKRHVLESEPTYPLYLYKYLSKEEFLGNYLINSCFFLRSSSEFNNPFEMGAHLTLGKDLSKRKIKYTDLVNRNMPQANWKKKREQVSLFLREREQQMSNFKSSVYKHTKDMGIMCFTQDHQNLLMWSHYANHQKGFVLEFDIAHDVSTLLRVSKVEYSNEYPTLDYSEMTNDQHKVVLLRKSEDWKYEQEWRIVIFNGANAYLPFKPTAVTGLIFGCRADFEMKKRILSILEIRSSKKFPPLRIYEAVKHPREYKVTIQEDHSLKWPS